MENIEVLKSNYSYPSNKNYTAYQMILPLDLEKKIEKDDPVHSFLEVMEGVNWNKYLHKPSHKGRDEYDPFKMIKVILFAYMNQIYSLRRIEQACKTDIRFMFIMQEEKPNQVEQFKMPKERISKFFSPGTPAKKMEDTIVKALELYRKRQRDMER